jgi:hypothetical protein
MTNLSSPKYHIGHIVYARNANNNIEEYKIKTFFFNTIHQTWCYRLIATNSKSEIDAIETDIFTKRIKNLGLL